MGKIKLDTIKQGVGNFVYSKRNYAWVHCQATNAKISAYMRKSNRYVGNKLYPVLDLANVGAEPKGQGAFTELIQEVESRAAICKRGVFVESLPNMRLARFLLKRGYRVQFSPNSDPANLMGASLILPYVNKKEDADTTEPIQ